MKKSTQNITINNQYWSTLVSMRNICTSMNGNPRCISFALRMGFNNNRVPKGEKRIIGNKVYVGGKLLPRFDEKGNSVWTISK